MLASATKSPFVIPSPGGIVSKVLQPQSIPDPRPRYSQGIPAEGKRPLFIAGQTAVDAANNVVGKCDAGA